MCKRFVPFNSEKNINKKIDDRCLRGVLICDLRHLSSRSEPLECPSQTFHLYSEVTPQGPTVVLHNDEGLSDLTN